MLLLPLLASISSTMASASPAIADAPTFASLPTVSASLPVVIYPSVVSQAASLPHPERYLAERNLEGAVVGPRFAAIAPSLLACIFRLQEKSDIMSRYPDQLSTVTIQSSESVQHYQQKSGYYAVHYRQPVDPAGAEFVMADDAGGAIAVFKGEVTERSIKRSGIQGTVTPVYSAEGGLAAIPTGQVFVRFADGVDARDRAADLEKLGYEIVKVLSFAPQGAWVRAKTGSIPESLENLRSLEGLAQVEKIEPQMLLERSLR